MNQEKFWKIRSVKFNNLEWVSENSYLEAFIDSGCFNHNDFVLDVGTGTGVIAHSIAPLVKEVLGLDISKDMLDHSKWTDNKNFIRWDIRKPIFKNDTFDKITARMVFHHILEGADKAMDECFRIMKKKGKMILAEGIPPKPELKNDYMEIFKLKEERVTFLKEDLVDLMKNSGFINIKTITHVMKSFSVKNWLVNSGLPNNIQSKIFDLHINGSDTFKEAYQMKIIDDDCLIDVINLILIGEK